MIKEHLKKINKEEEKRRKEEEERIRQEEEAERIREEKLRKEKERKEKKKQKNKERKERLKKEGKLLTAKQKADWQRAKMSLEILKQQGLVIGRSKDKKATDASVQAKKEQKSQEAAEAGEKDVIENDEIEDVEDEDDDEDEDEDDNEKEDDEDVADWEELTEDSIKNNKENSKPSNKAEMIDKENNKMVDNKAKELKSKVESKNVENKIASEVKKVDNSKTASKPNIEAENEAATVPIFRSPVICVLGHVDTGKTKLLDYIRKTHVQDSEAGGITQQIGATFVPPAAIIDQCKYLKKKFQLQLPGLLIIDTPGHESFTNLRSRGSSLCDIAILVIDIMHGLEPQTIESINLLKSRKTPFVVALNKIDRLYLWKSNPKKDVEDLIKHQQNQTRLEFEQKFKEVVLQLNEQGLNAALFYDNPDIRTFVSLVPTSAATGDGMGNLIGLVVSYSQTMLSKMLLFQSDNLRATVLEVKAIPGLGTTIDVIIVNGKLSEGDKIVMAGHDGPFVTSIRSLLVPQPLRELRVKSPYQELKHVYGSIGVKVTGHDLARAIAGLELYVADNDADIEKLKNECWSRFGEAMKAIKCSDKGVYVQASTLGSLEALLEFLRVSKIPYSGVRIGPVVKKDVIKSSVMLEIAPDYAVILAFDVKVDKDAQELADILGVKIFTAEIIYHLFDKFTAYREDLKQKRKEQYRSIAVFPCKLRILPQFIFNARDPIVVGVCVEDGFVTSGVPLAVPSKGNHMHFIPL